MSMESALKKRSEALEKFNSIIDNECSPCKKPFQAGYVGKDSNPICNACPTQHQLKKIGPILDQTMFEIRFHRKVPMRLGDE